MNGRQLVVQWVVGLACILFLGIGTPDWMRRGLEQFIPGAASRRQSADAARRDSIAVKALVARQTPADSMRRAAGDSARAISVVPVVPPVRPDSQEAVNVPAEPPASKIELRIARLLILIGVPLALLWNTYRWWKGRAAASQS